MQFKFFFTAPLDAAYMCINHGIDVVYWNRDAKPEKVKYSSLVYQANPRLNPMPNKKYWVHPDCHKKLEPLIGDTILTEAPYTPGAAFVDEKMLESISHYNSQRPAEAVRFKVIYRNDLPFIFPQEKKNDQH